MLPRNTSALWSHSALAKILTLSLLLTWVWSCAKPQIQPPESTYYVAQEVTYLLERPAFGSNILGPLYRGDKVERVGSERDWWQVTLLRSGQTGWIRKEMLSSKLIPTMFYYVKKDSQALLECPRPDCLPIQMLFRGTRVQKIADGGQGWWRVLVIKSRSLGWIPAASLTDRLEETQKQQPEKSYYYVAVTKLALRAKPAAQFEVIRTLQFNDQVEKMAETKGWFKVRQPSSGVVGWVKSDALKSLPSIYPRGRRPTPEKLRPFKQREEPEVEPKFM